MRTHKALQALLIVVALLAGTTPAVLAGPATLEGQVVCSQCWSESDRSQVPYGSPGDLACAARCNAAGVPAALAVRTDEAFELLLLDEPPADARPWLEIAGRFVRVAGDVTRRRTGRVLRAATVQTLDASPWVDSLPEPAKPADAASLSWAGLRGHPFSLDSLRGRVVVLNFWATWCTPCREEMPALVRLQNSYGLLGVQVLGAAADPPDRSDKVTKFARATGMNFPVVLGATTLQMEALGLGIGLPATVVLDREGGVVERFRGVFEPDALEAAVERALLGAGPPDEHAAHGGEKAHVHMAAAGPQGSLVPS